MYDELIASPRALLGPGPSEANARVLKAMTTPMLGYMETIGFQLLARTSCGIYATLACYIPTADSQPSTANPLFPFNSAGRL